MPSVKQVIKRLLPFGTNQTRRPSWTAFPRWPPDAFAVAATLVELSGCYCRHAFMSGPIARASRQPQDTPLEVAHEWGNHDGLDLSNSSARYLQSLWKTLTNPQCGEVCDADDPYAIHWHHAAMTLMALADEASSGIGCVIKPIGKRPIADILFDDHQLYLNHRSTFLPHVPTSLGLMVPPEEACVQPKTRTCQVGCTLRSFSHHLALLPPVGQVATTWLLGMDSKDYETKLPAAHTLNVLFVPFPYNIPADCFEPDTAFMPTDPDDESARLRRKWRFFDVSQDWLNNTQNSPLTDKDLADFLNSLIQQAEKTVGQVHALILPELALDQKRARQVAQALGKSSQLEIFISGVAADPDGPGRLPRNSAYCALFSNNRLYTDWYQSKHHRWKLEKFQLRKYHLVDRLHPESDWWEKIEISERQTCFYTFRDGMSLCSLICEDLARIDPVQSVLRAIGPNLVVALLMDGPQLLDRWASRYATVLADDPGSAVIVGTSLGLIRRQALKDPKVPPTVVLWKGAEGIPRPLDLDPSHHALLMTLTSVDETNFTLDGRSDQGMTFGLALSDYWSIKAPQPPEWATWP